MSRRESAGAYPGDRSVHTVTPWQSVAPSSTSHAAAARYAPMAVCVFSHRPSASMLTGVTDNREKEKWQSALMRALVHSERESVSVTDAAMAV